MKNLQSNEIKISIIIPSYNQGKYLENTIKSVIQQDYGNTELIIMDGGSTDNSVEIIEKYESYLFFWKSEKDGGQSNAINEGFKKATGKFKTWLNSDDILLPGALHSLNDSCHKFPDCRWFLGNLLWIDKNNTILKVGKAKPYDKYYVNKGLFTSGGPSSFMRDDLLEEFGLLREDFHYMMDTEMWRRLAFHKESFVRLENYIWALRLHEEAKMSGHNFKNSEFADKSHISWEKKRSEHELMDRLYDFKVRRYHIVFNKLSKLFSYSFLTRLIDSRYIGLPYGKLTNNLK
jgi:glycosyltransferase involved in cell wall biosynthesis